MIKKLIIANRGEVASRIIRTARRLGIRTVAVHSEADVRTLHVEDADECVSIESTPAPESHLKVEQVLEAAAQTGADAVHPGYGFMAEDPFLAHTCRAKGLVFVGPPTDVIRLMGNKVVAREAAGTAGLPVVPGSGPLTSLEEAQLEAGRLGYPVLLKAARGGGWLGMEVLRSDEELKARFSGRADHAQRCFGDSTLYLEQVLPSPRHIEVQIAGDSSGNIVHVGERECSIRRGTQKVLEETPCPNLSDDLRRAMTEAACRLAHHVGYRSLGAVDMLFSRGTFYFLAMGTRLQVEHSVTEMVTGLDLVEWQLRVAMGEELPVGQEGLRFGGHAFECRICAEDPDQGFQPSPGRISRFVVPAAPWVRNDVGVYEGEYVSPCYDAMIAKLIVHGPDRPTAIARLREALAAYRVEGLATNVSLHKRVVEDEAFVAGQLSTSFVADRFGVPSVLPGG